MADEMSVLARIEQLYQEERSAAEKAGQTSRAAVADMNYALDTCEVDPADRPGRYDMGYDGLTTFVKRQEAQRRAAARGPIKLEELAQTMVSEFTTAYGYIPDETAKLVASAFVGRDLTDPEVRQDFYERVAARDGKQPLGADRASVVGAGRQSGLVGAGVTSVEDDNANFLRGMADMQQKSGRYA